MAGLTDEGFTPKTLEEIKAEIRADLLGGISATLDLSDESPTGQLVGIFASKVRELWEQLAVIYASQSPDTASGDGLTSLAYITGTPREAATKSTVLCTVNLDAGTYAIGSLVAHVDGNPAARFSNTIEVSSSGGSNVGIAFEAENAGVVRANAGTLTEIAGPVAGWNSITNPLDAELGSEIESDAALRIRRELELARVGSTTTDAIRADVLVVPDVISCTVLENNTPTTVNLVPPYSVEALVFGGVDADVAEAIFNSKAATAATAGSTTVGVTDDSGVVHNIKFTRPATVNIYVTVALTAVAEGYAGDTIVKQALVDYADANFGVGADVIRSRLIAVAFSVAGITDVTSLAIDDASSPVDETNFAIGAREIADLDTSRIVIVSTLV